MTEREKFDKWFDDEKLGNIDPSQRFLVREIMWEGWKGKADNPDPNKK